MGKVVAVNCTLEVASEVMKNKCSWNQEGRKFYKNLCHQKRRWGCFVWLAGWWTVLDVTHLASFGTKQVVELLDHLCSPWCSFAELSLSRFLTQADDVARLSREQKVFCFEYRQQLKKELVRGSVSTKTVADARCCSSVCIISLLTKGATSWITVMRHVCLCKKATFNFKLYFLFHCCGRE